MSAWQVGVTNLVGVASRTITWRSGGQLRVTVIVKSVFDFALNGTMTLSLPPEDILEADQYGGHGSAGSIRASSDLCPFRPRVDVLFWGHAYAPGGKSTPRFPARLAIANGSEKVLDKVIDVVGDRGSSSASPAPITKMPVRYEHAYGGPGYEANPVGMGFGPQAQALPNLVYPSGWNRDTEPASLGPIPLSWSRRSRLGGNRSIDFSGETVVTIPDDLAPSYFQCAPEDQRIAQLNGGEWILLENLHPKHARLTMRLPDVTGMVMAFGFQGADKHVPLRIDTLLIDGDREKCIVTCRGSIPIPNEAALDELRLGAGIGIGGQPLDWRDARKNALAPTNDPVGTAVLDSNKPIQFSTPYEVAKPGTADPLKVRSGAPIPGAPFAAAAAIGGGAAVAIAAAAGATTAPGLPNAGEMTLIGGDVPADPFGAMPFSSPPNPFLEASDAAARASNTAGPKALSNIPGAPFAVEGTPPTAAPAAPPVGLTTMPLGDESLRLSDLDAMLAARSPKSLGAANAMGDRAQPFPGQTTHVVPSGGSAGSGTSPSVELGPGSDAKSPSAPHAMKQRPVDVDPFAASDRSYAPVAAMGLVAGAAALHAGAFPGQTIDATSGSAMHAPAAPPPGLGPGSDAASPSAPYAMQQQALGSDAFVAPDRAYAPHEAMDPADPQARLRAAAYPLPGQTTEVTSGATSSNLGASPPAGLGPGSDALSPSAAYTTQQRSLDQDAFVAPDRAHAPHEAMEPADPQARLRAGEASTAAAVGLAVDAAYQHNRDSDKLIDESGSGDSAQTKDAAFANAKVTEPTADGDSGSTVPTMANASWSWATPAGPDLSSHQSLKQGSKGGGKSPAEPSARALIYSGFSRK
jgi:hypothetical protein